MSVGANISVVTPGAVLTFATHVHAAGLTMKQTYVPSETDRARPAGAHEQPYGSAGRTGRRKDDW